MKSFTLLLFLPQRRKGAKFYGVLCVNLETFILAICHAGSVSIMLLSFVEIPPSSGMTNKGHIISVKLMPAICYLPPATCNLLFLLLIVIQGFLPDFHRDIFLGFFVFALFDQFLVFYIFFWWKNIVF